MREIERIEPNGFRVVSTFSGCGGSCLGFRMAGYTTVFASEFIPAAQETYRANHPGVYLDTRDIRQLSAEDILAVTGLSKGEVDVLEGSPPCASFSMAGKREAGWNKAKAYSDTKQRVDDLFFEYARIVDGLQPRVFVAENVKGLTIGVARGYLKEILNALRGCGYVVKCAVMDAQYFRVPQHRERLIFVGVRKDLGIEPTFPKPQSKPMALREALPWIARRGANAAFGTVADVPSSLPCGTIGASPQTGNGRSNPSQCIAEVDISRYAIGDEWDKLKPGEQSKRYFSLQKAHPDKACPTITQTSGTVMSAAGVTHPFEKRKFTIAELRRICGFPDDFILTGTFARQWERLDRAVAPPMMKAIAEHIRDTILVPARDVT
jgi:DNA (cytosine-5)-methyltransferase 1